MYYKFIGLFVYLFLDKIFKNNLKFTMDSTRILELISYTLPTIIMAFVAYSFFELYTKNENAKRNYLIKKNTKPDTLSLRLQAYERMTLFLERINPSQLLVRIAPISENKIDYQNFVIAQIEQEYEHNLAQQIYVSEECWSAITTSKNTTIQMILLAAKNEKINDAHQLREFILNDLLTKPSPSSVALAFLKNEVGQLW